jgi:hypothetical protein
MRNFELELAANPTLGAVVPVSVRPSKLQDKERTQVAKIVAISHELD